MTNPSTNNNSSPSKRNGTTTNTTTNKNVINGDRSAVPENSPVGPSERALKHPISLSKDWTLDEQLLLETLLTKYASDDKVTRYAKIASKLQGKTVRDVALRCIWMTENATDQQVDSSSSATNHSSDDDVSDEVVVEIDTESRQLLEENVEAMNQISANFSASKIDENFNLFSKVRNNIRVLSESFNDVCEIMQKMPPLPSKLNDNLANIIIPK